MGANSSVSVSNITVCRELKSLFVNKLEIEFRERFIDDIFLVINVTNISNIDEYLHNLFTHSFLKFTHEWSKDKEKVNFLDLTVHLTNNNISTTLYKKPISKHQYLHFESNHPIHVMKSLPYSAGRRIIKCYSDRELASQVIITEMEKFTNRGYPKYIINECIDKLKLVTRDDTLIPKKPLILSNLRIHNPEILSKYNITITDNVNPLCSNIIYLVVPFYKQINNISNILKEQINNTLGKCKDNRYVMYINNLKLRTAYKITNNLSSMC